MGVHRTSMYGHSWGHVTNKQMQLTRQAYATPDNYLTYPPTNISAPARLYLAR
jgi:hypothetical protein